MLKIPLEVLMKDVLGFEGIYAVDEHGSVWSFKWGNFRKLKPGIDRDGYHIVNLCKDGKQKTHKVHRLIAQAYLKDYSNDLQVDHINGDRINNKLENLRMVTQQKNQWNQTKAKGYTWNKNAGKWQAQIKVNGKVKNLGLFDTEQEAHDAYLKAKQIYHII